MRITFYGAASEVTGSKHLVEIAGRKILLDCGALQTSRHESYVRNAKFDFDPMTIDAVVISHAHFDHIGLLPLLVKGGFKGKIWASGATRDLTELILLDAAKIQMQEAEFVNRHRLPEAELAEPLYTPDDIPAVMTHFDRLPYGPDNTWRQIAPGVDVRLYDAGHILGSAVIALQATVDGKVQRLVYTGDLGRWNRPLLRDPQLMQEAATVAIAESTYGDRLHHPSEKVEQEIIDTVNLAIERKSQIIVPAFSLGRTQQLIYILHWLTDQGRLPRVPIVVDSPLAQRVSEAFTRHQRDYDTETTKDFTRLGEDPLKFTNLRFTHSVEESKALNSEGGPVVIISASGMASGGRVVHHLRRILPDPKGIVLFTGYQATGTLGRRLVDGARDVRIYGDMLPVRATIKVMNDLSAHADASQIDEYLSAIPELQKVFLVHGEVDRAVALQAFLKTKHVNWDVKIPKVGESFEV